MELMPGFGLEVNHPTLLFVCYYALSIGLLITFL